MYRANEWMTFYYEVRLGNWGSNTSHIKAWVAYEGEPLRQFIDLPNTQLLYNYSPSDGYDAVDLLTYMTGKSGSQSHPTAYSWYDELIISTQPIAGPSGDVIPSTPPPPSPPPVTPPADTTAPDAPTRLEFE